jgi:hypothetical protein
MLRDWHINLVNDVFGNRSVAAEKLMMLMMMQQCTASQQHQLQTSQIAQPSIQIPTFNV